VVKADELSTQSRLNHELTAHLQQWEAATETMQAEMTQVVGCI